MQNETKLYQDWYELTSEEDVDTVAFSSNFSVDALKKRFNRWFETHHEMLRHKICDEWEYSKKKTAFESKEAIIIAISVDCLAVALSLPTTNVITVGTILVVDGYLDKLCPNSKKL